MGSASSLMAGRRASTSVGHSQRSEALLWSLHHGIAFHDMVVYSWLNLRGLRIRSWSIRSSILFSGYVASVEKQSRHVCVSQTLMRNMSSLRDVASDNDLAEILQNKDYNQWNRVKHIYENLNLPGDLPRDESAVIRLRGLFYDYASESPAGDSSLSTLSDKIIQAVPTKDLTVNDFRFQIGCYIDSHKLDELPKIFFHALDLVSRDEIISLLKATFNKLNSKQHKSSDLQYSCIKLFASVMFKQDGTLLYTKDGPNLEERSLLLLIFNLCPETTISSLINRFLDEEQSIQSSNLASTTLYVLSHELMTNPTSETELLLIFRHKKSWQVATPLDLTLTFDYLYAQKHYQEALAEFDDSPLLHRNSHFDTLLKCHAALKNWAALQKCFESLFGRGELPNLEHYRIVISALSELGRVDIVDLLFDGLVSRKFEPSVAIFNSMLYTRFAFGSHALVMKLYKQMHLFSVEPDHLSYIIMLMSCRDMRNLDSAMILIKEMLVKELPVGNKELSILLSLCAKRRDCDTAQSIWKWAEEKAGIVPDEVSYNSLISVYCDSGQLSEAKELYSKMKESGVVPTTSTLSIFLFPAARLKDENLMNWAQAELTILGLERTSKWYAGELFYLSQTSQLEKALELFDKMKIINASPESTVFKLNARHYGIMVDLLARFRKLDEAEEIYKELRNSNIVPTFKIQAKYLALKARSSNRNEVDGSLTAASENFLRQSKTVLDLTSDLVPRNQLPSEMLKVVARELCRKKDYFSARLLVAEFIEAHSPLKQYQEDYKVYALMLEIFAKGGYFAEISNYWNLFLNAIRARCYVPVKTNASTSAKMTLPWRYRKEYYKQIDSKLLELSFYGRQRAMMSFHYGLEEEGFAFTSKNYNTLAKALIQDDQTILEGWDIVEHCLLSNYKTSSKNTISRSTRKLLQANLDTAIQRKSIINNCSKDEGYTKLKKSHPLIFREMEFLRKREASVEKKLLKKRMSSVYIN